MVYLSQAEKGKETDPLKSDIIVPELFQVIIQVHR